MRWSACAVVAWCLTALACRGGAARPASEVGDSAQGAGRAGLVVALDSIASSALTRYRLPGMAVVVLHGDDTVMTRGYGRVDLRRPAPVETTTTFQLGSIGKQFLAALVVALVGDGRIALDDPVATHLPGFPHLTPALRVHHLLEHTSGIRELFLLPGAQAAFEDLARTREELVETVRQAPVDFTPGSRWSYSNSNYTLLALLVERVTGQPYEDVLVERFFRPLGLTSMHQCASVPRPPREANGHEMRGDSVVVAPPENMNWIRGDGGLCGHALDLARWTRLLASGRVVAPALYTAMTTPARLTDGRTADYGFALSLVPFEGERKVAHNGAMRGFSASAAYYPGTEWTVVVLANRGDVRTESVERAVARRLLGLRSPTLAERTLDAAGRRRFAGTYDIGPLEVQIVERAGRLWLESPRPGPTTALRHLGDGEFAGVDEPDAYRVTFTGTDGPARELRLLMAAMHWYGVRRR